MDATAADLEIFRQWFNNVQDINPQYLTREDYALAKRVYVELGLRVPQSILRETP